MLNNSGWNEKCREANYKQNFLKVNAFWLTVGYKLMLSDIITEYITLSCVLSESGFQKHVYIVYEKEFHMLVKT